jgi:hypothetical protein
MNTDFLFSVFIRKISEIRVLPLIFWDADKDLPLTNLNGIRGDVHDGGHLDYFPRAEVELRAVTRADDVEAFDVAIAERTVIVGADIADGKVLSRDVENDDGTVAQVHKEAPSVGEFGGGGDFDEI